MTDELKYILEELINIKTDLLMAQKEIAALKSINTVLALRLCEAIPDSKDQTMALFEAMVEFADHFEEEPHGAFVRHFQSHFAAFLSADSAATILGLSLLAKDAGRDGLEPLQTWLSQASSAEIQDDILAVLKKNAQQLRPDKPQD